MFNFKQSLLLGLLLALGALLSACQKPLEQRWDWTKAQQQVAAQWGERQLVALDLGLAFSGQFMLQPPSLRSVSDSRELLWLDVNGEVEFSAANGELVYRPVPVRLEVRTRLRREGEHYLLLEPEVKQLEVEFPVALLKSLAAETLADDLAKALVDKPLFAADAPLKELLEKTEVLLQTGDGGLRFVPEASPQP